MARAWYVFNGSTDTGASDLPENYAFTTSTPTCQNGRALCAIYAVYGGTLPSVISSNLKQYIADGRATGAAQPTDPAGSKLYAYFLPIT